MKTLTLVTIILVFLNTSQYTIQAWADDLRSNQNVLAGTAPPGDVLRPGHLGRQTGDLERIIHFYHDLLGTGIRGER